MRSSLLLALLLALLLPLAAAPLARAGDEPAAPAPYAVGATVADFSGPALGGGTISLADLAVTPEKAREAVLAAVQKVAPDAKVEMTTAIDDVPGLKDEEGEVDTDRRAELVAAAGLPFGLVAGEERAEGAKTLQDLLDWIVGAKDWPIVVMAWASGCDTCKRVYNDKVNEIAGRDEMRLLVLACHPYDTVDLMKTRIDLSGYVWRVLLDPDQKVSRLFGATRTPDVFLLDQGHVLRYRGAVDADPDVPLDDEGAKEYLRQAVRAVREGKEVEPKDTEPCGCPLPEKKP